MARFATNYSVILGKMPAHSTYVASVPSDRDQRTLWRMNLSGAGGRACSAVP
jgi:hypothetical protein